MPADLPNSLMPVLGALLAIWLTLAAGFWWVVLPWLRRGPGGDPRITFVCFVIGILTRILHRTHVEGADKLRDTQFPGGLIVVGNHTGGIDPILVQIACRFHIRWMMASAMMGSNLDWLWRLQDVIPVYRDGSDTGPMRVAIRHVKAGGVLGIFPESRIVVPPREVRPFFAGVGLIIARTKAPVLLVWTSGTADTNEMAASMLTPSHARLIFFENIQFPPKASAQVITDTLREKIASMSGWPMNDEPLPQDSGDPDPFA